MTSSALYNKLLSLAQTHAEPESLEQILAIRAPDARHAWGHKHLVSKNPGLADIMDNNAFTAHLHSSGPYIEGKGAKVHEIIVDEHKRKAVIHMSYFLAAKGSEETVEQDLVWVLTFTEETEEERSGNLDGILINESVEFIDASTGMRVGSMARALYGELSEDVRGSITVTEW